MRKITIEDQLKCKANFIGKNGRLHLVRCLACPDAGDRGRENWAPAVTSGACAWCGWDSDESKETDEK